MKGEKYSNTNKVQSSDIRSTGAQDIKSIAVNATVEAVKKSQPTVNESLKKEPSKVIDTTKKTDNSRLDDFLDVSTSPDSEHVTPKQSQKVKAVKTVADKNLVNTEPDTKKSETDIEKSDNPKISNCPASVKPVDVKNYKNEKTRKYGANFIDRTDGTCCFRVWGPHIEKCSVYIGDSDANCVTFPMVKDTQEASVYHCQLQHCYSQMPYHFIIESNWNDCCDTEGSILHRRDPYARCTDFETNTCYIQDFECYSWTRFDTPEFNQLIIYEIHVGTFATSIKTASCFTATIEKLPYIKNLGFNAIELMPVQEFGGLWGYNPRVLTSIHSRYGTPEELRCLVDECHKHQIAVIFDLVLNRGSVKLNSLWRYDGYGPNGSGGIYFASGKDSEWGQVLNYDDKHVCDMIVNAAVTFALEYNADGLRIDAVHQIPTHLLKQITEAVHNTKRCYIVAEVTPENPKILHPDHGRFDSCWIHASYYDTIQIMKHMNDFKMCQVKALIDGHSGFDRPSNSINSLLGSHDQCGNRKSGHSDDERVGRYLIDQFGGRENWHARAKCRMLCALQTLSRPIPMTFFGTETHQGLWWHVDKPMDWTLVDEKDTYATNMMALVKDANKLRLKHHCFTSDSRCNFCHEDCTNNVVGFCRDDQVLVVVAMTESQWDKSDYSVSTPWNDGTRVKQIFNCQAEEYGGWPESWTSTEDYLCVDTQKMLHIKLPKWSVLAFAVA